MTIHICLSGYYFVGSRGDELLRRVITKDLSRFGRVRVINCANPHYREVVDWCDVFVLGGGSLVTKRGTGGYDQLKYAKSRQKKIMLYAHTLEEGCPVFQDYLQCADVVTVRDTASHALCRRYGYKSILSADPAIKTARKRIIHVGLRAWVHTPDDFMKKIAGIVDFLTTEYTVILTPYVLKDTDTISDMQFSKRVEKHMRSRIPIKSFQENSRPDLFIGMRLHSLICSVTRLVPTIAVDYDGKIGNFMRDIGKEDFLVEYGRPEKILSIVEKVFLKELVEREKKNIQAFKELIEDFRSRA